MMLAAALTAGQAFAEGTAISGDGGFYIEPDWNIYEWDGNANVTGNANDLKVTVASGDNDYSGYTVYGAYMLDTSNATNNTVVMTGGDVFSITGAFNNMQGGASDISGNKVILTGGQAFSISAAENYTTGGTLTGNHAVIAGGHVGGADASNPGNLWGGHSDAAGDTHVTARNNTVSLVGNGGSITVDGQKYEGHAITINADISAGTSDGTGNALDIYGKDITLGGDISGTQVMNFHLVDGLSDNTAMLMHMGVANLNLTNVTTYGFDGSAVANWAAYNGKSIMLLESYNGQILGVGDSTDVEIMGADGSAVATATLGLANGGKALSLTNIQSKGTPTPEPTTGVLSLLALAALAGRKRRK